MQTRQGGVHGVERRRAFVTRQVLQRHVPQDPALDLAHQVEDAAGDALVFADAQDLGHGEIDLTQGRQDPGLTQDVMSPLQKLPWGLAAQHIVARRRGQQIGRVRLPALELADAQRPLEAGDLGAAPGFEPSGVQFKSGANGACAAHAALP